MNVADSVERPPMVMVVDRRCGGDLKLSVRPQSLDDDVVLIEDNGVIRREVHPVAIPSNVLNSVVYLRSRTGIEGTGFIVGLPYGGVSDLSEPKAFARFREIYSSLVTARHVARSMGSDFAVIANVDGARKEIPISGAQWREHPDDAAVDIAAMEWGPSLPRFEQITWSMFGAPGQTRRFRHLGVGYGDEVFTVGLLFHLPGQSMNVPLVRTGTVAMMPDDRVETEAGNSEVILIEVRSIPGMSGAPVILKSYTTDGMEVGGRYIPIQHTTYHLLGVNSGGWDIKMGSSGAVMVPVADDYINLGIAHVHPIEKLVDILDIPEMIAQRPKPKPPSDPRVRIRAD